MLIYQIPHYTQETIYFVCDSQATIDAIPLNKQGNPTFNPASCVIGTQVNADDLLAQYQQAWLVQQAGLFTVNLQTTVEGGVVWTVVNLNTEPPNIDKQYFVLDPTDGLSEPATGLDAAKTLFAKIQQEYLVFTKMNSYTTMTSWT